MAKTMIALLLPRLFLLLITLSWPASGEDDVSLQSLVTLTEQQAASIQSLQARVVSLETSGHQAASQLAALTSRVNKQVYFTAHMSTSQHPITIGTSNAPLQFDEVVINFGNAYNSRTGVFTAPASGVYVFYAQMMKHANVAAIYYVIEKSGTAVCKNALDAGNDYDKSSCLATIHVQQGETVFVRREKGADFLQGWWSCGFSGFLLAPDAN